MVKTNIFKTSIGECAICWKNENITHFFLPDRQNGTLSKSLLKDFEIASEIPSYIKKAIKRAQVHLDGDPQDFSDLPLYQKVSSELAIDVFEALLNIPPGKTLSYKELAKKIRRPSSSRIIGTILGQNKIPLLVPCHRIILSSGGLGGYSAGCGVNTKSILLELEKPN